MSSHAGEVNEGQVKLRYRELYGEVPTFHLFSTYFVLGAEGVQVVPNRAVEESGATCRDYMRRRRPFGVLASASLSVRVSEASR